MKSHDNLTRTLVQDLVGMACITGGILLATQSPGFTLAAAGLSIFLSNIRSDITNQ